MEERHVVIVSDLLSCVEVAPLSKFSPVLLKLQENPQFTADDARIKLKKLYPQIWT